MLLTEGSVLWTRIAVLKKSEFLTEFFYTSCFTWIALNLEYERTNKFERGHKANFFKLAQMFF